ncbi:centriolin [Sphaeramia orbicularis]|uniref:centriolin n=1 Tax=Sphaeramia orbicularis TaxID=375764 RepID=UPI00117E4A3E|nr:centriolin-like [Sphaeramia orbicularis]
MEDQVDAGGSDGLGSRGGSGMRPITEELLLNWTRCPTVDLIHSLNRSPSAGEPHIQFIENLHGRQRLQVQNLNQIQRMDQLSTLTRIRHLELDHSHIRMDSVPLWLGRTLHLQQDLITSLYEVSRLRSLSSLSQLSVSGSPASSLPHSRLFLLYHIRTLTSLDQQPITEEETGHAQQPFHTGEPENKVNAGQTGQRQSEQSGLQREVNLGQSEQSSLQRDAITWLHQQEETNPVVTDHTHTHRRNRKELEQELHAKTQLLEQTRAELSQTFQRLYHVEQELTFYKLDRKLRPLHTCSAMQDGAIDTVDAVDKSPYIGKARLILTSVPSPSSSGQSPLVDDCRTHGRTDEDSLKMHNHTEEDTQQQETTHTQEALCRLLSKLIVLETLKEEAEDMKTQKDELDTQLHSLDTTDTQPVQNQLLVTMNRKQSELEGRLDDTLSRIAIETQEIKELEQQLTDGQILVNEVLQRDLEDIIRGLQQNLRGLRDQARVAEQQIQSLKMENQGLQLHLEDSQRHCRQLEEREHTHSQLLCVQQGELSELHSQAHTLRGRQVELEAELQHLREELICQLTVGQDETVPLQQTVHKLQTHLDQTTTQVQQTRTLQRETRSQLDQITASVFQDQQVHGGLDEISPQDLGLCMETQRTRTSRMQNKDHTSQLEVELDQDQKLDQDQDLELASDWRLKEEVQGLRDGLQRSQTRSRLIQQNLEAELQRVHLRLEDVQQERDTLLSQFRSQSDSHQRAMERMDRKLRRLSRAMCESDQLMADQLRSAVEQLTHMNHSVDLINTQKTDDVGGVSEQTQTVEDLRTRSRTSTGTRTRDGGQWCFVPGLSGPSLGSQGTQDSGLGLQYLSSPDRGRQQHTTPAGGGGPWVNVDTGSEWSDPDRTPPPGPGPGPGPGYSLCGPQTPLVCPSCLLSASLPAEGAALHCNIPEHRDLFDNRDSDKLDEEKKKLRLESKRLRQTLRRHSRAKLLCEEVECVEETLLKRRAELREADRLLLEARSRIQTSRDQVELMELRAEDHTTAVTESQQHLRELQEEEEELRTRRRTEEQRLKEVEEELKIREEEKQRLDKDSEEVRQRLSLVSSQCLEAQRHLDSVGVQVQQEEQSLIRIRDETTSALRTGDELRNQERRLHARVQELSEQQEALAVQTRSTVSALTQDRQRLASLQTEISSHQAELKQVLQELLSEQQTLEDLKTKRNRNLQRLHRKKDELETTKDELETTKDELETTKDKLDKMDEEVDRKKEELVALQQEVESHREKVESCLKETEQQRIDLQDLQEELSRSSEERRCLQEQCKHLEARRRHAHRCLSAVEAELTAEREEHSRTQLLKQEVMKETAANQQQLNENSELLSLLSSKVEERKTQLHNLEQEVGVLSQQQQKKKEQLTELDREIQHKQMVCVGLEDRGRGLEDRGRGLEDRGRRLDQQQLHLQQLRRELQRKEEGLQQKEEGLQHKEEGLQRKEEELQQKEEGLQHKEEGLRQSEAGLQRKQESQRVKEEELQRIWEELHKKDEDVEDGAESQGQTFYLSTAGPGSAFGSEGSPESDREASTCGSQEPRWAELQEPRWAELQAENLRREEDRLKARLRCRLWTEQENLKVKGLQTQDSLLGLRHTLDRLDSLLAHTH